jgi:hypothetical protein
MKGFSPTVRAGPASVAQWIEHRFPKPCVAGSIPARGTAKFLLDNYSAISIDENDRLGWRLGSRISCFAPEGTHGERLRLST